MLERQESKGDSKMEVWMINVVDQDGVSNALVPGGRPAEGHVFPRALKIHNETGATSWISNDNGELPQAQSPDDDYSDLNTYGITWHYKR
jgi:hypothetical protein